MRQYNIRLDQSLVQGLDKLGGCRSVHVRDAIQLYLQGDTKQGYDRDVVDMLQSQIVDLKRDKEYLQSQNNALLVARSPTLKEWIVYRLNGIHK